jgi:AraC family transcriptional activator of mar-sox-rob regulon
MDTHMNYHNVLRDTITWIDTHLEYQLSIDDVSKKVGYSKWHLQRIFKETTGRNIGEYIRDRKLSKAAIMLKTSNRSILDVGIEYLFDSQQTFTRAFKKKFNDTPAHYRYADTWDMSEITPPMIFDRSELPNFKFISLPNLYLIGESKSNNDLLNCRFSSINQQRDYLWEKYLSYNGSFPTELYGLSHVFSDKNKMHTSNSLYTLAFSVEDLAIPSSKITHQQVITIEGGDYIKFSYEGCVSELHKFVFDIYENQLNKLKIIRRKGCDIEIFFLKNFQPNARSFNNVLCDYFIPICNYVPYTEK